MPAVWMDVALPWTAANMVCVPLGLMLTSAMPFEVGAPLPRSLCSRVRTNTSGSRQCAPHRGRRCRSITGRYVRTARRPEAARYALAVIEVQVTLDQDARMRGAFRSGDTCDRVRERRENDQPFHWGLLSLAPPTGIAPSCNGCLPSILSITQSPQNHGSRRPLPGPPSRRGTGMMVWTTPARHLAQ